MGERELAVLLALADSTGGIGRHVHAVAAALVDRGHRVSVAAPAGTDAVFGWAGTGASFVPLPVGSVRGAPKAGLGLRNLARVADVVHAHGTRAGALAAAARVHPLVVTWHNAPGHQGRAHRVGHSLLERAAARGADATLAAAPDLADRARRAGAPDPRVVAVAAPALPASTRPPELVRRDLGVADRPLVLAVARLAPQKRLDVLVEAAAGWADEPGAPVVVVAGAGDEPLSHSLVEDTQRRASGVRFLGHRDDVADLLAAADAFVLTSDWEARPLVLQEALRAGVPVVASDVGGVRDVVGAAAVLVPAGDAPAVRRALLDLLADPAERARLAAVGRAQAATLPSLTSTVDELFTTYLDLLSR